MTDEGWLVGAKLGPRQFGPVSQTDIVRFAGASGDLTPTHHDEQAARAAGFPTVFAMGMFQASILATCAFEWMRPGQVKRYSVRFVEKVWPGDILTCTGQISSVVDRDGGSIVCLSLECRASGVHTRQGVDSLVLTGSAEFWIY